MPKQKMKKKKTALNPKNIFPIGIGAWGIGGFAERDPKNNDDRQVRALIHSLKKGMNFMEINFWNSQGKSVELISKAIKLSKVPREKLFLCLVIYNYNLPTLKNVKKEIENYFELFETDYIDSLEFAMTTFKTYGFDKVVKLVENYISKKKTRYTSLTNCNLEYLKKYHAIFGNKLLFHELAYSFEIRANEELGITTYAEKYSMMNVLYQPLRRNRTAKRNWPLLVELSNKYSKTQNQIVLNWLRWKGFYPLVKSETITHINENLSALKFEMDKFEYIRMDRFKVPGYTTPIIDWWQEGKEGEKMHMLPNIVDDIIDGKYGN